LWLCVDKACSAINITHLCEVGRSSIMSTKSGALQAWPAVTPQPLFGGVQLDLS